MTVDPNSLTDPRLVRTLMENANRLGRSDIVAACVERLAELRAGTEQVDATVELDCWKAIGAAEEAATIKNGRTTRMSRTRQKVARAGILTTMADLAGSERLHQGFELLKAAGQLHLTFEFVVLKYPEVFSLAVRQVARHKLLAAGMSDDRLPPLNS